MKPCNKDSKKYCMTCRHYAYCDIAKRCDGICDSCDVTKCENNPEHKEKTI